MATNPYPGVDAHLNSYLLQPDGGWESFHAEHIIRVREALDAVLPDDYYAASEKSLQIGGYGVEPPTRTRPDVSVYMERRGDAVAAVDAEPPTQVLPIPTLTHEFDITAVNIYRAERGSMPGVLVTRVEVLSPANKPGGSYAAGYQDKREETLKGGVHLVELDYLHTTAPIMAEIASYPSRQANATPYYVLVTDPHPFVDDQPAALLYGVAVDAPLPRFAVPLAGEDAVALDLQAAYNTTYAGAKVFGRLADYTQPPVNFDAYRTEDQAKIRAVMNQFQS